MDTRSYNLQIPNTARCAVGEVGPHTRCGSNEDLRSYVILSGPKMAFSQIEMLIIGGRSMDGWGVAASGIVSRSTQQGVLS